MRPEPLKRIRHLLEKQKYRQAWNVIELAYSADTVAANAQTVQDLWTEMRNLAFNPMEKVEDHFLTIENLGTNCTAGERLTQVWILSCVSISLKLGLFQISEKKSQKITGKMVVDGLLFRFSPLSHQNLSCSLLICVDYDVDCTWHQKGRVV